MESRVLSVLRGKFSTTKSLIGLAVGVLFAVSAFGLVFSKLSAAPGGDCTPNSIIECGVGSASEFVAKANENAPGDLQTIYADYGLVPSEYARFASNAKSGTSFTDGRIEVDGRTVATGTSSIGRTQFSYSHAKGIGGKTYYESATTSVQKSNLPVLVLFNEQGGFEFAVITTCGNPISGNPSNPSYSCDSLNTTKIDNNTYKFTTNASAGNGAAIAKVVYDFGDGTATVEKTNPAEEVTHTYAQAGNYQAKVTVHVSLPGGGTSVVAPAGNCVKNITIEAAPAAACTVLTVAKLDRNRFRFDATGTVSGGATISRIDFFVRDTNGKDVQEKSVNTSNNQASAEFTVANPGSYTAQAYVIASTGGAVTSEACKKSFTVEEAPVFRCVSLQAAALNDKKTEFRFTVNYAAAGGATLTSADFSLDGGAASNVTPVDGVVSKDYTFAQDGSSHTVKATLNFTVGSTTETVVCSATVTSGKTPMCPVPGKEHLPVDSPECQYCPVPGKQNLPKDSPDCKETPVQPEVLPSTGAGDAGTTVAIVASASILGYLGHFLYRMRREG
ncbi:MAG: PKD domain-containing protein [Candidatus Saccharimonadales bacterium]